MMLGTFETLGSSILVPELFVPHIHLGITFPILASIYLSLSLHSSSEFGWVVPPDLSFVQNISTYCST